MAWNDANGFISGGPSRNLDLKYRYILKLKVLGEKRILKAMFHEFKYAADPLESLQPEHCNTALVRENQNMKLTRKMSEIDQSL